MKKYALHIGLNKVDPVHYDGWDGELFACVNDCEYYESLSKEASFDKIVSLHDHEATAIEVLSCLDVYANELSANDLFFLTYAAHGGTAIDLNKDEKDGKDETWCLYDRQLIDDELFEVFKKFKTGVKIYMISDSCHSGTVARGSTQEEKEAISAIERTFVENGFISRNAPENVLNQVFTKNSELYLPILQRTRVLPGEIDANVLLFAGCQDNETSKEFGGHGVFTRTFKEVVKKFDITNYAMLFEKILENIPNVQTPNIFTYGNQDFDFRQDPTFIQKSNSEEGPSLDGKSDERITGLIGDGIIIHQGADTRSGDDTDQAIGTLERESQAKNPWDDAYATYFDLKSTTNVDFVEANTSSLMEEEVDELIRSRGEDNTYLKNWPKPPKNDTEFIWHLDNDHSQLRKASQKVTATLQGEAKVRIGHIDTGYVPEHPGLPENLLTELGKSYLKGKKENKGQDILESGAIGEQDGHGTATMAILAGGEIKKEDSYTGYEGEFGAVPFAEIVPIRVSDTVYKFFKANNVAKAIDYAVKEGCEVITMSMAGYPTKSVANAVNRAYKKGVIVVTAAGNNWFKNTVKRAAPKTVLFPAAFDRVVAATGACSNHVPYDYDAQQAWMLTRSEGGEFMQGNWGPKKRMKTAVAGYTPNLAWASVMGGDRFHRSGGGTSSATPQVAATFALWVAYNRKELDKLGPDEQWKKVEAARYAVFKSAKKNVKYGKYYGNGIIRAYDALEKFDFSTQLDGLKKANEAKVSFLGVLPFLSQWMGKNRSVEGRPTDEDETLKEMISLEVLQVMYQDPAFKDIMDTVDFEDEDGLDFLHDDEVQADFKRRIHDSEYASEFLKNIVA